MKAFKCYVFFLHIRVSFSSPLAFSFIGTFKLIISLQLKSMASLFLKGICHLQNSQIAFFVRYAILWLSTELTFNSTYAAVRSHLYINMWLCICRQFWNFTKEPMYNYGYIMQKYRTNFLMMIVYHCWMANEIFLLWYGTSLAAMSMYVHSSILFVIRTQRMYHRNSHIITVRKWFNSTANLFPEMPFG